MPPPEQDEKPRTSAPPPDFDDDPVLGVTRQTPKEELDEWRKLAAKRQIHDEVTRAIDNPPPKHVDVPTREVELSSEVIALAKRGPTSGAIALPPAPIRPAIPPVAHSYPPEAVPPAPPIGVSIPPGLLSQSLPAPAKPAAAGSRWPLAIAALVLLGAAGGAAALVLMPADAGWGVASPAPASPVTVPVPEAPLVPAEPAPPAAGPLPPTEPVAPVAVAPVVVEPVVVEPVAIEPVAIEPVVVEPVEPVVAEPVAPLAAPTPPAPGASPDDLVRAGDEAAEAHDHGRALDLYQQAIALDGHHPYAFAGAARASLELGRTSDAVRFAERAVANRRRRASFRVLLGDALSAAGNAERARAEWEEALSIDPDDAAARERLGR